MTTTSESPRHAVPDSTIVGRHGESVNWALLDNILAAASHQDQAAPVRRIAALELIGRVLAADYVAWLDRDESSHWHCTQEGVAEAANAADLRAAVLTAAAQITDNARSGCEELSPTRHVVINHLVLPGGAESLLAVICDNSLEPALVCAVLRLIGLDLLAAADVPTQGNENADSWMSAAVLGLSVRLAASPDTASGAKLLADLVCQHLRAERVAIARVESHNMKAKLTALSDVERADRNTEAARLLEDCLNESISLPRLVSWSNSTDEQPPDCLPSWGRLAELWKVSDLTALQLHDRDNHIVGTCLIANKRPLNPDDSCFLSLVGQVAGPLLKVLERGTAKQWISACRNRLPAWATRWWSLAAAAIVCTPLISPWPCKTSCPVLLEPQVHRLIAAPFEGIFEQNLVLPGDHVNAGQLLGRMDGREVRTRLAAIEADLARASKSRDADLAAGKIAEAQINKLQYERLAHEKKVLTRRLKQVEITSPISGILVSGDLKRHEGATVKVGQSMYEVAPLEKLIAEIAVPEEDLELVVTGAPVTLRLDAFPGHSWDGHVERIAPRAEPRDNRQVFIAETMLTSDEHHELRPGMKGTAKITGPNMPGFWLLARKPFNTVRRFLGW
ncbi:MAG TPA: efflux RND transporter periplasmic adaptor subunit [Pirellulaceae bacterium]|jgi:biotin carboxyl carrier protein